MNYLKQKLEEKHISQTELAKRTGINRSVLNEYVVGKRKLSKIEHVIALTYALDIDIKEFIEEILK